MGDRDEDEEADLLRRERPRDPPERIAQAERQRRNAREERRDEVAPGRIRTPDADDQRQNLADNQAEGIDAQRADGRTHERKDVNRTLHAENRHGPARQLSELQ